MQQKRPYITADMMHNKTHVYCSFSERTECGNPEDTHSQSPAGQQIKTFTLKIQRLKGTPALEMGTYGSVLNHILNFYFFYNLLHQFYTCRHGLKLRFNKAIRNSASEVNFKTRLFGFIYTVYVHKWKYCLIPLILQDYSLMIFLLVNTRHWKKRPFFQ